MASDPFKRRQDEEQRRAADAHVHVYGSGVVCVTDNRGKSTPRGLSPFEIVLDASEGFIPLWAEHTTLRWRFQDRSFDVFTDPASAKATIRSLLSEAVLAWGDATPVKFAEREDAWDFEVVMKANNDCTATGCVLASAFFPDAGRHALNIFPKMLEQSHKERVETLVHEIGHAFGLRHFFAEVSEGAWPSVVFGKHKPFSIMNYGANSELTEVDKADLRRLYEAVWSGQLTQINGTPIRVQTPFHAQGPSFGLSPLAALK